MAIGFVCSVSLAGPMVYSVVYPNQPAPTVDPVIMIGLKALNGAFNTSFAAHQSAKSQMLAVALAAMNTQSTVSVWIDDPSSVPAGQMPICYSLEMIAS
jgi:hypothetical protein